jgi:glycerol kinase
VSDEPWILAVDQGTTSSRALLFDRAGVPRAEARRELPQSSPAPGRVEQDPDRIFDDVVTVCREALDRAGVEAGDLAAMGITNQRETTVLWERSTGRPVHPAIVWQDRRTADRCRELRERGVEDAVRERTGLLLDPYFSATKLAWLLEEVDGARAAAERGELAFGTVDAWLLWRLTGGRVHATDTTNASRTMLFDIRELAWDDGLLELFGVPRPLLPEVRPSSGLFGETDPGVLGEPVPVTGVAGDQQAATFGQAAFEPGTVKATYGTGAFLLVNTGDRPVASENRLLTTVAWTLGEEAAGAPGGRDAGGPTGVFGSGAAHDPEEGPPRHGSGPGAARTAYALEGSIFSAGSAVKWLRDGVGLVDEAAETGRLAEEASARGDDGPAGEGIYLVPAFDGLGAPHWDPDARAALLGMTRDVGRAEIARATLEAVAYQTRDLMEAVEADWGSRPGLLRVDGGMARSEFTMGFLSDMLDLPVERPSVTETTALGAARLAGLAAGVHDGLDEIEAAWRLDRRWEPGMDPARRERLYAGWRRAVGRVLTTGGRGGRGNGG